MIRGHRFGLLPWHTCHFEVFPMSLEDLFPMSSDHTPLFLPQTLCRLYFGTSRTVKSLAGSQWLGPLWAGPTL